jgi:hypothetical protein
MTIFSHKERNTMLRLFLVLLDEYAQIQQIGRGWDILEIHQSNYNKVKSGKRALSWSKTGKSLLNHEILSKDEFKQAFSENGQNGVIRSAIHKMVEILSK